MARHNSKPRPRGRLERELAERRESELLLQLERQAEDAKRLQAAANEALAGLKRLALQLARDHELDITDIASASGISRQTIHAQLRTGNTKTEPLIQTRAPRYEPGMRVVHRSHGVGTIERADGDKVLIRFDSEPEAISELHARIAGVQLMSPASHTS